MTNTAAAAATPLNAPQDSGARDATEPSTTSVVACRQLTRSFDDDEVIHPLDLDIEPGTILGLIGPSGCGKTTTVRLLTGLLAPTTGSATVFGRPTDQLTAGDRARIGYLPQTPALFPDLSLAENLSFHASMYGLPFRRRHRLDQLLDWVELSEHRRKRVADASGGMQRRLALAAAFVHDPDVVFLDEPTAGIDPILRDKLWDRFREVAEQGKTLLVTTQYVGEAGQCDLVGLLSDGELLLLDTPANLRRAAFDGEVVDVRLDRPLTDDELARLGEHPFVVGEVERIGPSEIRIVVDDADRAMSDIDSAVAALGSRVVEMDEHVVDYDEAFVRVVERHRERADQPREVAS
ncbi:MAG TPA: ABC transporter ATP-binding protein [Ilumatobacter sp.]|nr:ABC transporter ATP-binding protein [Ilumatobacter sp.]